MPSLNYTNGGMAPVSATGIAKFRVIVPNGYTDKKTKIFIPPHFHYRICIGGKLGPVHTQFFKD